MPTYSLVKQSDGNYSAEGELSFFSLNEKTIKSFDFLKSAPAVCIDLRQVSSADSAGLALIIEWIKHSILYDTKLSFKNIPQQLLTLAKLSNFDLDGYLIK
jgi:phospholipid transport system transporter-binding protein